MRLIVNFILFAAILWSVPTGLSAQETATPSDTLIVTEKAKNIVVTQSDGSVKISISGYGNKLDNDYTYTSSAHRPDSTESDIWDLRMLKAPSADGKWRFIIRRFYMGGSLDTDGPIDMAYWRSFDYGIQELIGVEYSPWRMGPRFSIGAGMGIRRVSTHKDTDKMLFLKSAGEIAVQPSVASTNSQLSWVDIFHLDVPVSLTQPFSKHWAMSVGATVNFNTYVVAGSNYKVLGENEFGLPTGHKVEESYKHLYQRPVTVEFNAAIGYLDGLALYVKYSPMPIFKDGKGPKFKTISFGIMVGF
ncbi:MAG: hypothetical protein NC127_01110 [Muribaculum sp.]|nr:hypothetical protein [Muribaculum sp.]